MLNIGDFSRITSISIRMLRYYDQNDILKPHVIDEDSGYRYYERDQIFWAGQIRFLRDIGFSTAMIKEILTNYHEPIEVKKYMKLRLLELQAEASTIEDNIQNLQKAMNMLDKEDIIMNYEVQIKTIPAVFAVTRRGMIPTYEKEGLMWSGMCSEIAALQMDLPYTKDQQTRCYFYDEGYKEQDVDIEIAACIEPGSYKDTENLKFKKLVEKKVASITFRGDYAQTGEVTMALAQWFSAHEYEMDGVQFMIYHVGYMLSQNPEEFVTEICWPIK